MNAVKHFIQRVRKEARLKPSCVTAYGFGKKRVFSGYDWGSDTFIFENNIWKNLENHSPVLIVKKSDMQKGTHGYVFTLSSGNHGVALVPLVSGKFWNLGSLNRKQRQKTISNCMLCANVVNGSLELTQRDVKTTKVVDADMWLQSFGFGMDEIIFSDRNIDILDVYRRIGQEWRVKPLAWNINEMRAAVQHSRTTISSKLQYYHSSAGVHFLSLSGLRKLVDILDDDYGEFINALKELVFVYAGQGQSNMRSTKRNNHHEIELFGVHFSIAENLIIPEIESLMNTVIKKKLKTIEIHHALFSIFNLVEQSLESPELADSESDTFIETIYIHLTGEIYHLDTGGTTTAFDARRIALPGATYRGSRADYHPSADTRSKVLIQNIEQLLSHEEQMEYVNVYELRNSEAAPVGKAVTREIVFKTNRRPLTVGLIEKRLALSKIGYGGYLLARVQAFKMLGINIGQYRLITHPDNRGARLINFFLRDKCPGESLEYVKPSMANPNIRDKKNAANIRESVMALCSLIGNAAAQNLVMKKYIPAQNSCRFGEGKEIYEVGFDVQSGQEIPLQVTFCSVRGALGWKNTLCSDDNLNSMFEFYLENFARTLVEFSDEYSSITSLSECTEQFLIGFECKTKEMFWIYVTNRDGFDNFDPNLSSSYSFRKKWKFVLWALEKQHQLMEQLHEKFRANVSAMDNKTVSSKGGG